MSLRTLLFILLAILFPPITTAATKPLLLVMNKHEDSLAYVDPDTLQVVAKIPVGHDPHELVITPDGRFAYASNYAEPGNTISVIDLVHRRLIQQIPTGEFIRIHSAAITPDGKALYFTAGQTGCVVEVDPSRRRVVRAIPTHGEVSHMVEVSPDGKRLYTANIESRNVSVIDRASGRLITQIPCDRGCEGITFTPDGTQLWAGNQDAGSITIIDVATHRPLETLPCKGMPLRIRFTRDGRRALVSSWVREGEVVIFDVPARREIKRIRVGNQPIGLLMTPDEKRAFVTSMSSDEIHVIDLTKLEVSGRFVTGKGCDAMAWWTPPEQGPPADKTTLLAGGTAAFETWLSPRGLNSDPLNVFRIEGETLQISGREWGGLITRQSYDRYLLTAEFRWTGKTWPPRENAARDSGIIVHSTGEPGAYSHTWMYGIEVQIIEGGTGDLLVVGDATPNFSLAGTARRDGNEIYFDPSASRMVLDGKGRLNRLGRDPAWKDVAGFRRDGDVERPLGEWNRLDCLVNGSTIHVVVNGVLVNACTNVKPDRGRIQIQSESAGIEFRRLDLVPYAEPPRITRTATQASGG